MTGAPSLITVVPQSAAWFAVALRPHADALACEQLTRQGFEVRALTIERTVRHARQFRTRTVPLFPGYLFIRLDLEQGGWRVVNGTRGVRGLVMVGDRPGRISAQVVEALQLGGRAADELHSGDLVEVIVGPLAGFKGRLERLDGRARVMVLMQLLGGSVAVSLPRDTVRATE